MFTTHHKIGKLICDIVIYHGINDDLIHPTHSIELYNLNKDKIKLMLLIDANHDNILNMIDFNQLLDSLDKM